jgi:hypothetical protein
VEEARALIESQTGVPGGHVMISATHSHTGPIFAGSRRFDALGGSNEKAARYTRDLPKKIAAAVAEAARRLEPAQASHARRDEPGLAFNRRFHMRDGSVGWNPGKLNPNIIRPAGPVDHELQLVCFARPNQTALAACVNFPMHLDTVGGTHFSADYPHVLAEALGRAKGRELVTLFTIGCAGEINHIDVRSSNTQKGQEEAARIGTILAGAALKAWEDLRTNSAGALRVSSEMVDLPLAPFGGADLLEARKVAQLVAEKANPAPAFMAQVQAFKVLDVEERQGKPLQVEVQVISLGDIAWVSLPGEIFVELGLSIKAGSPFKQTIIAELANGSIGYIPTVRACTEGNYEVVSARCAPGSGEALVESAIRQLRTLHRQGGLRP